MKQDGFWFVIFFGAQVTIGYTSILNETQKQECGAGFIVVTGDCVDTDECQLGICHPWATCENTIGSYNCECQPNSSGDGVTCVPDTPCEPGWITFPGSKSCYKFSTNVEDLNSAQVSCAAQNASLICIDDEEELAFFGGRTTGATWMGLNDLETEGRYVCGNGEGLASRPWAYYNEANEPSEDTTKRCAASVHRFSWGFDNCNATKRSACKAITSPCPEEWAEYPQLSGQCFAANNDHLTFHEAREKCEGMHPESKMITMSSVYENEFLGVQSETPRWLGLTKFQGESEWISVGAVDDGYRNWLQPHLAEGRNGNDFDICAVLLQSLWFVHDCSDEHFYVCEKSFPKSNRRDSLPQKRLELNERITKENCRSQR